MPAAANIVLVLLRFAYFCLQELLHSLSVIQATKSSLAKEVSETAERDVIILDRSKADYLSGGYLASEEQAQEEAPQPQTSSPTPRPRQRTPLLLLISSS